MQKGLWFFLKIRKKASMLVLTTSIQHHPWSYSQCYQRKENVKPSQIGKKEFKSEVFVCVCVFSLSHDLVSNLLKNILRLMSLTSSWNTRSIYRSVVFWYIINKKSKKKIRKLFYLFLQFLLFILHLKHSS